MDVSFFLKGSVSGMVGILLSHPCDTIKTCVQNKLPIPTNPIQLYRGIMSPLFGVGLEKAVVFGTFNNTKKIFSQYNSTLATPIAGGVSGFMASFIVTPVERIKILIQSNNKFEYKTISPKFLFKGLTATFSRETPGFAIYFSLYETLKTNTTSFTNIHSFIYGGLSGATAWAFIYPQDRIKTIMQTDMKTSTSFLEIGKHIITNDGVRGLYKGFKWALCRAVPLHAATFATMELLS